MSKETKAFQECIKQYLDKRAAEDSQFAAKYQNPKKSIDQCCDYIIGEVSKSGRSGYADDEVYGMAVHYYDEEDVKIQKAKGKRRVVINQPKGKESTNKKKVKASVAPKEEKTSGPQQLSLF